MKRKNKDNLVTGLGRMKKFHLWLSVGLVISLLFLFFIDKDNISRNSTMLHLVGLSVFYVTFSFFFGMFALPYHIVKSNGAAFIILSLFNLSWVLLAIEVPFRESMVIGLITIALILLGNSVTIAYIIMRKNAK